MNALKKLLAKIKKLFLLNDVHYINGPETLPPPLSKKEEEKLLSDILIGNGNDVEKARQALITHNLRLVVYIAKKFENSGVPVEDLISIGTIGLIKSVNTFRPEKNIKLATYSSRCIENEILMLIRANKKHKNNVSIYEGIGSDKDGNELTVMDLLAEKGEGVLDKVENSVLRDNFLAIMKNCLTEREYKIVCLRFGLLGGRPLAQREVASLMRISRSYVSRLEKKAIYKLRSEIKRNEFLE